MIFILTLLGNLDRDAEVYQYTDIAKVTFPGPPRSVPYLKNKQSILVKDVNIYEIAKILTDNTLFLSEFVVEEEPEIVLDYW